MEKVKNFMNILYCYAGIKKISSKNVRKYRESFRKEMIQKQPTDKNGARVKERKGNYEIAASFRPAYREAGQ